MSMMPEGSAKLQDRSINVKPGSADTLGASYDPRDKALNIALWQETLWEYSLDNPGAECGVVVDFYDATGKVKVGECTLHAPTESNPYDPKYGVYTARIESADIPGVDLTKVTCAVRMVGPYAPLQGLRYNPHKSLMLPGTREFVGIDDLRAAKRRNDQRLCAFKPSANPQEHERNSLDARKMDTRENADLIPKAKVQILKTDEERAAESRARPPKPGVQSNRTIMEVHVGGFTKTHPLVPEADRGTFRGMADRDVINFIKDLGVTSIELMPVLQYMDNGATNVWGYDPLSLHSIHDEYGSEDDLRALVDAYHEAGIEVITDVVYNHTAEGNHLGHTLMAFDPKFYFHVPDKPGYFYDYTGCGNSINVNHPQVSRLCLSSMRNLVSDIGVDGLRYDLGGIFGRMQNNPTAWDPNSPMFRAIAHDPVLNAGYLSAEPYDTGENGYHLGGFRNPFREWNKDGYQEALAFADGRADASVAATFLAGSSPKYDHDWKDNPPDGVRKNYGTFVADHDTPRVADYTAWDEPNNGTHGGGHKPDKLKKVGKPGPNSDPKVINSRLQIAKDIAVLSTATHGDILIHAADIVGHSQGGDTNPYCVLNPNIIDWSFLPGQEQAGSHPPPNGEKPIVQIFPPDARRELMQRWQLGFHIRREDPTLLRREFPHGDQLNGGKDIEWVNEEGKELVWHQWHANHCFGMMHAPDRDGQRFLWYFNSNADPHNVKLPPGKWNLLADADRTASPARQEFLRACRGGEVVTMPPKTALIFRGSSGPEPA